MQPRSVFIAVCLCGLACAKVNKLPSTPGQGGAGGAAGVAGQTGAAGAAGASAGAAGTMASGAAGGGGTGGLPFTTTCPGPCTDFPAAPVIEAGVPPEAPAMFGAPLAGGGPCVTEPEDGALFPRNWLRPRVKFRPAVPGTVHEIRVSSPVEANDLVVYTTADSWALPKSMWAGLASHAADKPVTVSLRAPGGGATSVKFFVAPATAAATGSIVYWAADPAEHGSARPSSSGLQGFSVGDESTVPVLGARDVQMQTRNANNALRPVTCIGCHSSTPDGESVAFVDNYPWNIALVEIKPMRQGLFPDYLTPGGTDTIRQPGMGIFAFSRAHWQPRDRIIVSPYYLDAPCTPYDQKKDVVQLAWLDVEAPPATNGCPERGKHFDFIARNGDPRGAANPAWSHDGRTIVYSSTNANVDGRLGTGASDLYQVPYGDRRGGDATPLAGAADPGYEEYYPAFSPDDKLVVYDRVPAGGTMYANPKAELFVVPVDGDGEAFRLPANDPPVCSGLASPGVNNHWAKWAPDVSVDGDRTYYWLIFSSNRYGTPAVRAKDGSMVQVSQLYATAVVASPEGLQMYPAIYLWNQNPATLNTTPAWDAFQIPVVP